MEIARKAYVPVMAYFDKDGNIVPVFVTWEDGNTYEIDKVLDIRPAASLKAGGAGIRYKCKIKGKETYIFLEETKWFVEAKQ